MNPALILLCLQAAPSPPPDPRPRVLVIQRALAPAKSEAKTETLDYPFATLLAGEIESDRRVLAVVWSEADPTFRAAVADGRIAPPSVPSDDDVRKAAKALGCRYILTVTCGVAGDSATGSIRLEGDAKFEVTETAKVSGGLPGSNSAVESVARILGIRLAEGPFKRLPPLPVLPTSARGQLDPPAVRSDPPQAPPAAALADAPAQAQRLIAEGRTRAAVILLRDAVDADPLDPARRIALLAVLRRAGLLDEALAAARAAAELLPEPALRVESARILLAAGRRDEARTALNEGLARDPAIPGARLLLAEIAMRSGAPADALPHLEAVLADQDPKATLAPAYRMRAVARALLGGADGVELDWKRAEEIESPDPEAFEGEGFSIVDDALATEGATLRLLFQKAAVRRDAQEVADGLDAQERLVEALLTLTRIAGRSVRYAPSRETRTLGLNLLRQSLGELRAYVASGKPEDINDARLSLGESLRNLAVARAAHLRIAAPTG